MVCLCRKGLGNDDNRVSVMIIAIINNNNGNYYHYHTLRNKYIRTC